MCVEVILQVLVTVSEGVLNGEILRNVLTSEEYYSFKGIPFAKPPVGCLRFQNPAPPEKYEGIWDATQERSPCVQQFFYTQEVGGDEDCLYLNVFTPKLPEDGDSLMPVMFYLYGGGATEGQKDAFLNGPDYLVSKDVVLVIPNYRLHIFGFLNLGIDECPGNVGLKDQVAALKWTKANIRKFGGDPDNVLIFGESTGAASILFLLHSPLSRGKGLFHKAILQSGNILSNRSFITVNTSTDRASRAAKQLGFESKDTRELYNFLMQVPAYELTTHALNTLIEEEKNSGEYFPFVPSVEVVGPVNERLIVEERVEIMKRDPGIPIMMGVYSQEAILLLLTLIINKRPPEEFLMRIEGFVMDKFFRGIIHDEETKMKVIRNFLWFYFRGRSNYEEIILGSIDLYSDVMFIRGFHDSTLAILESSSHPLYLYLFSLRPTSGLLQFFFDYNRPSFLEGAGHTDQLGYLFHIELNKEKDVLELSNKKVIEYMTSIWTTFAKYSNPGKHLSVDFKPASLTDMSYLEINENLTVKPGFIFEERMKFIDSIYAFLTSEPAFCSKNN